MITLEKDVLVFRFPEVHPDAVCRLDFQRTLRIPDDDKEYPLPAGFGRFPIQHIADSSKDLPSDWAQRGGILVPMHRAEALWINFCCIEWHHRYPFAFKIAAGKINAISGQEWSNGLSKAQDYLVIPEQPWLDGFCVEKGVIRQFVAIPLGEGATVEEQLTGKAEHGGLQIIAYPMKSSFWEQILDQRRQKKRADRANRAFKRIEARRRITEEFRRRTIEALTLIDQLIDRARTTDTGFEEEIWDEIGRQFNALDDRQFNAPDDQNPLDQRTRFERTPPKYSVADSGVGLGAGGRMLQAIRKDPYGIDAWDMAHSSRCFVTMTDVQSWCQLTGRRSPTKPPRAKDYKKAGIPWFDYYDEARSKLEGSSILGSVKTVIARLGPNHGIKGADDTIEPENIIDLGNHATHRVVDEGEVGADRLA